jgi:hypothetical protein
MTSFSDPDNSATGLGPAIPRMVGDTDIEIARLLADRLTPGATLVEFGPWLGGVTEVLGQYGTVHVIDRFKWSDLNAERVPGLFAPGDDFRPAFEANMGRVGLAPVIHQSDFSAFAWDGGAIDYCFIDAPRSARDLHDCLRSVAGSLRPDAPVLIKHGANRAHFEMAALIHLLLARGDFVLADIDQPAWCNIAVLKAGRDLGRLAAEVWSPELLAGPPPAWSVRDAWGGEMFAAARIALPVSVADWRGAYDLLETMPPLRRILHDWDEQEAHIKLSGEERENLHVFSSIFGSHHGGAVPAIGAMSQSESAALRGAWARFAGEHWRTAAFAGDALRVAYQLGGFDLSARLGDRIAGKHLMIVGRDLRPLGIAAIASGAASFVGLETGAGDAKISALDLFGAAMVGQIANYATYLDDSVDTFAVVENFVMTAHLSELIGEIESRLATSCSLHRIG